MVLTACGKNSSKAAPAPDNPAPAPAPKAGTQKETLSLALYYAKMTDTDAYLVRETHLVPYTEDGPRAAINELISASPKTAGAARTLPPRTRLLGISIKDGLATVNFSREVLAANVGAAGEALGIQSIVNTLTEFPQIREVSFQVEGNVDNRTREWWGHVGLYEQPFKRSLERVLEPDVWVTHPVSGQVAGVPMLVRGSARALGGTLNALLLDPAGKKIAEGQTPITKGSFGRVDFEMKLTFTPPGKGNGILEVYRTGPGEGTPAERVKIPIQWP